MDVLSDVHDDSEEVIKPICIIHVVDGIKEAQLKWERDAVRQLDQPDLRLLTVFLVFKALKMQCEDVWEFLDLHPRPKYNQRIREEGEKGNTASRPLGGRSRHRRRICSFDITSRLR